MSVTSLDHIDLLEDTWAVAPPDEQFAVLRREAPVYWHECPDDPGFWAVTKHADVRAISRDWQTYSTEVGSAFIRTPPTPEALELTRLTLLNMDPPKHTRYRALIAKGFTPKMIRMLTDKIHARAVQLVADVAERDGAVEFVSEVAALMPLQIICDMIGIPDSDQHLIFDWSNRLVGFQDPDFRTSEEDGQLAAAEIYAYCDALVAERREAPRDDLMSTLVHAEIDGDRLNAEELDLFFVLLCVAGNETTRNLISHAMLALIEHPDQRADLVAAGLDDGRWNTATEEFLRWGSSIQNFRRTATRDTEIRGQEIADGDKVVLFYYSANRDEEVFADPQRFDVRRSPNDHVTFGGGGTHFCLGANLARLEIKSMIRELLQRYPNAELAGPVTRMRSDFINGIKKMPVQFTA